MKTKYINQLYDLGFLSWSLYRIHRVIEGPWIYLRENQTTHFTISCLKAVVRRCSVNMPQSPFNRATDWRSAALSKNDSGTGGSCEFC